MLSLTAILLPVCLAAHAPATRPAPMERIAIAPGARGFAQIPSGRAFIPWGLNYGNAGRLMEDFWQCEWQTLADDLREMRDLGANVARIHLQFGKFMTAPDQPDPTSLDLLGRLLQEAERVGIYLDLTGLACYRTADVPAWYDRLDERARWDAHAAFWEAVAARCARSPAVFCYDLMNEPLSPGGQREPGQWYSGKPFGGYDFLQWIALDQQDRPRDQIARDWIRHLTRAIRRRDPHHLITVGLLPSTREWGHLSGFLPATVAPELDFMSVHIYPEKGQVPEALRVLEQFAVGKPLVIEETFPLSCSGPELETFLRQSRGIACGWIGHYDGITIPEYDAMEQHKNLSMAQALWREWLRLFVRVAPEMTSPLVPTTRPVPATAPSR